MKYIPFFLLATIFTLRHSPVHAQPLVYERFENSAVGTVSGGVRFVEDVVGCGGLSVDNRYSASFDGQAETCISFGLDKQVTSPDFTVEAFVKLAERGTYESIAADWDEEDNNRCWAFVVTPRGGLRFDVSPDGSFHGNHKLETPSRLIEPNRWYHVAAVSQGSTSRIYVNGHQVAEAVRANPGIFTQDQANLKIGNVDHFATAGPRPWHGCLDEVRISTEALGPDDFIQTRDRLPEAHGPVPERFALPFTATSQEEAVAWQKQARARLFELVERQQPRHSLADVPLDFQLGEAVKNEGYTLSSATFQGNDGKTRFRCQFAVPDGKGPFPAMLALHGHGGKSELVFDKTSLYHGFADRFARGGYVVIAPSFPHREYCATMLWDLLRLVDILQSRSEVDPERLGVGGLSMGGEWTMWSAACDPRLKAAVVSGWMCTTEGVFAVPNCECWELPGFVDLMDVCEVHLMIAPRPVLFESAAQDPCFPLQYTKQGFARIQTGYQLFDAADKVQQDIWTSGHQWHGTVAYPFIDKVLGGHAAEAP